MARGPKKHLKRLNAPKQWMLNVLGGVFAPRPSCGPHKQRESLPLIVFLRNRLNYALTGDEVKKILMQRLIKVNGRVRTDPTFSAGFMDVITIEKTGEHFRLIYDSKGRFAVHRISQQESQVKLCRVRKLGMGPKGVPFLVTDDGRTIRYADPAVKISDTIQLEIATSKIVDSVQLQVGNLGMVTGGHNLGRLGLIINIERHPGSFDIVYIRDSTGLTFSTRLKYVFVIGKGNRPYVSLPGGKDIRFDNPTSL